MPPKKKVKKSNKDDTESRVVDVVDEVVAESSQIASQEVAVSPPPPPVPSKQAKATLLSVDAISSSPIVDLAATYWATPHDGSDLSQYDEHLVSHLYTLAIAPHDHQKISMLELSGYLENYLWPFLHTPSSTSATPIPSLPHLYSILVLLHEKLCNHTNPFTALHSDIHKLQYLFNVYIDMYMQTSPPHVYPPLPSQYTCMFLKLVAEAFRSTEFESLKRITLRYVSLPIWSHMTKGGLVGNFKTQPPSVKAQWIKYQETKQRLFSMVMQPQSEDAAKDTPGDKKKRKAGGASGGEVAGTGGKYKDMYADMQRDANFIAHILEQILHISYTYSHVQSHKQSQTLIPAQELTVFSCMLDVVYELLSTLPTRKYLCALLVDMHFIFYLKKHTSRWTDVFVMKYVEVIEDYLNMEMDNIQGTVYGKQDVWDEKTERVYKLQQVVYGLHIHNQGTQTAASNDAESPLPSYIQDLVFSSITMLMQKKVFLKYFELFSHAEVIWIAKKLKIFNERDEKIYGVNGNGGPGGFGLGGDGGLSKEDLCEWLFDFISIHPSYIDKVASLPTYPTEVTLWDEVGLPPSGGRVGGTGGAGAGILPLPKLNLSFLNIHDYFARNYILFFLSSSYEIKQEVMDVIKRMSPLPSSSYNTTFSSQSNATSNSTTLTKYSANSHPRNNPPTSTATTTPSAPSVRFGGWARYGMPIRSVTLDEVASPLLSGNGGGVLPSRVTASITIDISGSGKNEWEGLGVHDVVFLVCIRNPLRREEEGSKDASSGRGGGGRGGGRGGGGKNTVGVVTEEEERKFRELYGVQYIRGAEIFEVRDETGTVVSDFSNPVPRQGSLRTYRVNLDPLQYYQDIQAGLSVYEEFNLIIRRDAIHNTFKSVCVTIKQVLKGEGVGGGMPDWLGGVLLGGEGSAGYFKNLLLTSSNSDIITEDHLYMDTFISPEHIHASFPQAKRIHMHGESTQNSQISPPYRLRIEYNRDAIDEETVHVYPHPPSIGSVYGYDMVPGNVTPYTPAQVRGIRSGVNPGVSVICGPPGTGKTDVAVQVIYNLYQSNPQEKILVITHSNAALNDILRKVMERDVQGRHVLRLGMGERDLYGDVEDAAGEIGGEDPNSPPDRYTKSGRVQWCLNRRAHLLQQVGRLAQSLHIQGDFNMSCEAAGQLDVVYIQPLIKRYRERVGNGKVADVFPFAAYFSDLHPLFKSAEDAGDVEGDNRVVADKCLFHIEAIFTELRDYRPFEVLRTNGMRTDYFLAKQARIIAMTCTHAAMTRARLVSLGFQYDSVVIEEAGQILEVETMIPMLLQNSDGVFNRHRLKRVVLLGDANQLPPIIQHAQLAKVCKLEQSLFGRLVRSNVPHVVLDQQGRARPEIASLYSWRYMFDNNTRELGNLPHVYTGPYKLANAGFQCTYQFVNVEDFQGRGEVSPTPHYYQNLGEAEYVVATYQYMRLLGYPAEKISILTTYNGQKNLIQDVLQQRCRNALFGLPSAVSTVDKFQGQQNDYILLSLVRTESVGHIRDVRRLIVALSRAKLGLYVFGRLRLFESCLELVPAFMRLKANPTTLHLVAGEGYEQIDRPNDAKVDGSRELQVQDVQAMGVLVYQMTQQAQQLQLQAAQAEQQGTMEAV